MTSRDDLYRRAKAWSLYMEFIIKEMPLPVRLRLPQPMNDEELLRFCASNGDLRIELEPDGDILVMALVRGETGAIELQVGSQLRLWTTSDGRGKAFGAGTGFKLPDGSVRGPDAAWVSFDRWNALSSRDQKRHPPICPEFVIEVRSESDRLSTVQAKMAMWIANGVQIAWLIDPKQGEVTIYRQGDLPEILNHPSSVHGTGPIKGFELSLD